MGRERDNTTTVAVLTYHSLDDSGSILSIRPHIFAEQMRMLSESPVTVIPLDQLPAALDSGQQARLVVITFDDGFQNLYTHAFPVLDRYRLPATVFLVTDYCGRDNGWPSQPTGVERRPLLQWSEIKAMSAAGIYFGSHTRTHADLTKLSEQAAAEEMSTSKKVIEDAIGRRVDTFAYPYGAYNDRIRGSAQRHFAVACSTKLGFAKAANDRLTLERIDMYYLRRPRLFRRLFSAETKSYLRGRRAMRDLRGWMGKRISSFGQLP